MNINTLLALQYYDNGLLPIPLEGKQALVRWGDFTIKKPNRDLIESWFKQFPKARIGLVTGMISDTLVLDEDGEEGKKSLEGHEIPKTWQVQTPRGGHHYYFSFPKVLKDVKTTLANILPKVDVRGNAGYVVSVNGHKDYKWIHSPYDVDLAEAPKWLINLLLNKDKSPKAITKPKQNHWLSRIINGVNDGERHEAIKQLAPYYFSRMPPEIAVQHLIDWNQKNNPPYLNDELQIQINDFEKRFKTGSYVSNFNEQAISEDEEVMSVDEIMEFVPEPEWIMEHYIPKSGFVLLCGEAEKGKTWLALDLAIELTRGGKWLGQFPVKKSKVLYIDEEKPKAFFKKRLKLLGNAKHYKPPKDLLSFSFQKAMKLDRDRGITVFLKLLEKHKPDVVILDAFADFLTGKENDVVDILKIYDVLKEMRKRYHTTFIIIDHEKQAMMDRQGKVIINEEYLGNDVRGSKSKRNIVDTQLSFKMVEGNLKVFHSKTSWTIRQRPFIVSIDDIVKGESVAVQFKGFV